jgi:pyruvate dehydrogenase E2 component (dihydrolipoamide acetyltransferase)
MPVEISMPKLGLTMTEGKIIEWQKNEGDEVAKGDILFVLETEKVAYEVEAPEAGVLGRILAGVDTEVPVGEIVAYLLKPGESADDLPAGAPAPAAAPAAAGGEAASAAPAAAPQVSSGGRVRATPLAKKMAREMGVDLGLVTGTGPSGRVVAEDVEKAAKEGTAVPGAAPAGAVAVTAELEEKIVPLSGMRKAISNNMMASKTQTAQTYMTLVCDASAIQKYRKLLLPIIEKRHDVRVSITDLMLKITAAAIAQHPVINTRWTDEGVHYLPTVHMGMAMSVKDGLIVPVIRDINHKSLGQVALDRVDLVGKGRSGSFMPDDIKGSTFTLSSLGMFGIESFTANINQPESAILAVGAIIDKAVVVDGQIVVKPMVSMTLTYDHRIIDGADAGQFMKTLGDFMEEPFKILA